MTDSFIRLRIDPDMRRLLNKLQDERDIQVSRWLRRQVRNALEREFPDDVTGESSEEPSVATSGTPAPEPAQTPTGGTPAPEPAQTPTSGTPAPEPAQTPTSGTPAPEPAQTPTGGTREVPEPTLATKTLIDGWKPHDLGNRTWGAVMKGARVAELPDSNELAGTPIRITDSKGDSWTATLLEVVSRGDAEIVVTNSGRPRD